MDFLSKVEAFYQIVEADIVLPLTPLKINKIKQSSKSKSKPKRAKAPKAPSAKFATGGKGEQVGFASLMNTKKLTPFIEKELQLTDPFNFTNETWARFTKRVAPKLLVALLLDMNVVPKARKAEFVRYLERRLRTLSQT